MGEGGDRGWDGWVARWTWVWVNSGSWWWTGRPGLLQSMGSQRVGHDWATELKDQSFFTMWHLVKWWLTRFLGSVLLLTRAFGELKTSYQCINCPQKQWKFYEYPVEQLMRWAGIMFYRHLIHYLLEKAMAPHSSTLAWKIPWMEETGGLQSIGSLRVGHYWVTSLSLFTFMHWRRKWQPTPVFLPGESQGRESLVGCCRWGRTESDMTEAT